MRRKLKWLLPWLLLASMPAAAQLLTTNVGPGSFGGAAPPCPSPTAPDGNVDLSQCSNAFYVAVILF